MTKKPKTIEGWEKVCHNLNSALKLSIDQEDELIKALEAEKAANKLLTKRIKDLEVALDVYTRLNEATSEVEAQQELEIKDLHITITKSAGIINYLEMKLDRANSV